METMIDKQLSDIILKAKSVITEGLPFSVYSTILLLLVSCLITSCSSDEVTPEIKIAEGAVDYFSEPMDFPSNGGSKLLKFTTNVKWKLKISEVQGGASWCKVSQNEGGAGSYSLAVIVDENTDYNDRNVVLVLEADNVVKNIIVNQKEKNAIILTSDRFELDKKGGTIEVEIKSNVNYNVEIPEIYRSWISRTTNTRGLSTNTLSFIIAESQEYDKREGEIILSSEDLKERIKVYQTGSPIIILSQNEYTIDSKGGTIYVDISSNFEFNTEMPNVDWIRAANTTRALSSHTLIFNIDENKSFNNREATIIIKDAKSDKKESITIKQKAAITAQSLSINFKNTSGTMGGRLYIGKTYGFTVNVEPYNATTDFEWRVDNSSIASISASGNSATLTTKDLGKSKVIVTEKRSGISKSYDFGTCVTDFQFTETSRDTKYGYPVIKMAIGDKHQLKYSYTPSYATNIFRDLTSFNFKEINTSINTYAIVEKSTIVDIDSNGMMTAKKIGTTIIESNNSNGVFKSGYNDAVFVEVVQEIDPYGSIGGHGYVDLGLPSGALWATENLGAFSETDYGSYYLWPDIVKVQTSWGNKWSTPTRQDFYELINNCTYIWSTKSGVNGYLFTGKNGAKLFMPAAGFKNYVEGYGFSKTQRGSEWLIYWTSDKSSESWEGQDFAFVLQGTSSSISMSMTYNTTIVAAPIRPISR